ncbi:DNA-directed RNA polymerase II subunit [Scale drop disease virus]|uniref:DNA-directed RNA polymerase subunit beta n=1 Tax=Scale drop disease virus TaxID=1697349 RepID=A0A0K1L6D4_9VIRU|nr:ORF_122L [Scale drop disease virus]AKU37537.1 ORF_122L [Scale drop disease virus]QLI60658.1 DNA-directed RNA polymerase II subunit [Scale drop disease virus]QXJ13575.1 ORF122L [Scale drop disease virus]UNH60797.1 DNA-directed RNA polymerase II subunit [Scale drop disease virus]
MELVKHHIDSFNHLLSHQIPHVIQSEPAIVIHGYTVTFGNVVYGKPIPKTPSHARLTDETYQTTISCQATVKATDGTVTTQKISNLCQLPIMVRSALCSGQGECEYDPGGFFIIRGKERIVIPHIRTAYNYPFTFPCPLNKGIMCEMRTFNEANGATLLTQMRFNVTTNIIEMSVPYVKSFVPAGAIFCALNVTETEMLQYCNLLLPESTDDHYISKHPNVVYGLLEQYNSCKQSGDIYKYITTFVPNTIQSYIESVFSGIMFSHIKNNSQQNTAIHLGFMVNMMIETHVTGRFSDKDDLRHKRLDTSGSLILFLFKNLFKQWVCFLRTVLERTAPMGEPDLQGKSVNIHIITNTLNLCFATGNWLARKNSGMNKNAYVPRGVSQLMCTQNYGARLSHLRRIMHAVGFKGKNIKVRQLHNSHYGYFCPYETPEGERVGNVLQLALSAIVSLPCTKFDAVVKCASAHLLPKCQTGASILIIDGEIYGYVQNKMTVGKLLTNEMRDISPEITVTYRRGNCINIYTEAGRFLRPLINNKTGQEHLICPNLIAELIVAPYPAKCERIDLGTGNIADYTELPGHKVMTDVMTAVIPFYNHTQSPRNAYQSNMGKQAIGIPCLNFTNRWDVTLDVMSYPQAPMTRSVSVTELNFDQMLHGAVAIVAVLTFDGYNQEDSVILNRSSVQRGLFLSTTYKTLCETEKRTKKTDYEKIQQVPKNKQRKHLDYSCLNKNGIFDPDLAKNNKLVRGKTGSVYVAANTVVVGKMWFSNTNPEGQCCSLSVKSHEEGYFDRIEQFTTSDGCLSVKIRLRKIREPEIGDKFASFTAQKGTCGMMYDQHDMPFTADGLVPDLIINPHAFPSRMTIHYLLQMCFDMDAVQTGQQFDATAFQHDGKDLVAQLEKLQFQKKVMYCGRTGKRFPAHVFIAPCPYQRLKHMVANKMHARTTGPVDPLTRQPVAGRSREGGIKIGEMEQWCKISHGAASALQESMTDMSDAYEIPVCTLCKMMSDNFSICRHCNTVSIEKYKIPYTSKLLFQQLASIGIKILID